MEGTEMDVLAGVVRAIKWDRGRNVRINEQMIKHYETAIGNIEKEQLIWYDLCSKNGR